MKILLFAVSVAGLLSSLYFFYTDIASGYLQGHPVYLVLLSLLLVNSVIGIILTRPRKNNRD